MLVRRVPAYITAYVTAALTASAGLGLAGAAPANAAAGPALRVTTVASGLTLPWDLTFAPDATMLFTQRSGSTAGLYVRTTGGTVRRLAVPRGFYSSGELGMLGVVVDPRFASNRRLYTCHGFRSGGYTDVRVVPWSVNSTYTGVSEGSAIVTGMPFSTGRHSGCRLRFDPQNRLYVATGDAAIGTTPQDRTSLGGKVLRVDPFTGAGVAGNPFITSSNARTRKIFTYGHRNVQGLALRPGTSQMWSAEHGPDRDDEVNALVGGGNYGWDPVPGYNETVPMTDTRKFPNAVRARWSSGFPTIATSGATFLSGAAWGTWNGALAVANLKGSHLRVFRLDGTGRVAGIDVPPALDDRYGRLRTAQTGPGGALYVTTSNGSNDRILRVTPVPTVTATPGADVDAVVSGATGSGRVEVHTLARSRDYATFLRHATTAFAATNPADWRYLVTPYRASGRPDLIGVRLRGGGSGRIEVHVLTAASGYRTFALHAATPHPALASADLPYWAVSAASTTTADLHLVKLRGSSGRVEVHTLSQASGYRSWSLHAATPLPAAEPAGWNFLTDPRRGHDLLAVKHAATGSGRTEVHRLSRASGYRTFTLHSATPLALTTDDQFTYAVGDYDRDGATDLYAVKMNATASGRTEVHVLSGASGYREWGAHRATALHPTTPTTWSFSVW